VTPADPIRARLRAWDCPPHVVEDGLEGLAALWDEAAASVEGGYSLGLDDYLNDLDGRQLIEDLVQAVPAEIAAEVAGRIAEADRRFRAQTAPAGRCLWGAGTERSRGWSERRNWWYYRIPIVPGEELAGDLEKGEE